MKVFNLKSQIAVQNFDVWTAKMKAEKKRVKCEDLEPKSLSQNAYIHLLFSWVALNTGYTKEYVKQVLFKQFANKDIFVIEGVNEQNGEIYTYIRSWATVTKEEADISISRFIDYCKLNGDIAIPDRDNKADISYIQYEIFNNQKYV